MPTTIRRDDIVGYLDEYLRVPHIADMSPNGLQVEGAAQVSRIAYAVDASVETIDAACKAKAEMLIVHHGLWWGRHEQIVGNMYQRISRLIHGKLSLYAVHMPLDAHPEVGNNAELARMLDLKVERGFGNYKGVDLGVVAVLKKAMTLKSFVSRISTALDATPQVLAFGPPSIKRVAILSGEGAKLAEEAANIGCDTLFTGETSHTAYHMAKEAGVNLVFGGHYATETVGLVALRRHIESRYGIGGKFISAPTGY